MAGDWLKIEVCTPDKPEVIGIADMIGITPAHAFGSLFLVWRWFDQHTTEGNASYVTKVTIDRLSGNAGFADAMARVGWLLVHEDGTVSLPHFDRHNGETAKQRALTAKRVAKSKAKSNAQGNAHTVTGSVTFALPREEKRREEDKDKTLLSESADSSPPNCPIQEIVETYHTELPMLPRVRVLTKARESQIRQRWREDAKRQSLEWWGKWFRYVARSDFLTGRSDQQGRDTPWMADLEWLTKAGNFAKVIEGKYHA